MAFTTWLFGIFLISTVGIYWQLPMNLRQRFLLFASLLFLGYNSLTHLGLFLGLSLLVYSLAQYLRGHKGLLLIAISFPILALGYYKYQGLIYEVLDKLKLLPSGIAFDGISDFAVPLGISFIVFKMVHYLVEAYCGNEQRSDFSNFLLYIMFFPILPSGPIERYPSFLKQCLNLRSFQMDYLTEGGQRILLGLFKKLVIADTMAIYADKLQVVGHSSIVYWVAAYAYALQIYFDFSGYSDIAIGSARLFGYKIMENFDNPYLKRNISLFWKSWHISLTSWFRDYVFIPLGGSRVSFLRVVFNTLIVMALTGIWHGASLHFMVWGLYHGLGLIALRLYSKGIKQLIPGRQFGNSRVVSFASTFLTFHFVVVGWVFFVTDFTQSFYVIKKLFLIG